MVSITKTEHWETYLPQERLGRVELFLMSNAASLAAPIRTTEEIRDDPVLNIWSNATDVCIRNITHKFRDGPTYFCLVATKKPNALIARLDGFQCIVISESLPEANLGLALKILTSNSYSEYLDFGTPPDNPNKGPSITRDKALESLFNFETIDKSIIGSATLFLYIGAYFLCSHELGHLALGHLDRNDATNAAIVEVDIVTDEEKLESRAREWDADIFASAATLWYLGQLAGEEGWSEVLADYDKTFRFFMATTYHIFTVFDFLSPHNRDKVNPTHPEPMVRAGIIIPAIKSLILNWKKDQDEDVMAIGKATIRAFEIALWELTGGNMERAESERLQAKAGLDLQEIGEAFQTLGPTLDRSRLADLFFAKNLQ